jgi:hypothetical protein
MNNKVLAAFLGGLAVASGVMYVAMRRPEPAPVSAAAPRLPNSSPVSAEPLSEPAKTVDPLPASPAPQRQRLAEKVKPAPVPSRTVERVRPAPPVTPAPALTETPKPAAPAAQQPTEVAKAETAPLNPVAAPHIDPPAPKPNTVTIPAGTTFSVRLGETLSSEKNRSGDTFMATLDQPLVVDGFVLAERGSRAQGKVVESERAGKVKGLAQIGIELTQITTADGQKVKINTGAFQKQAESTKKKDAAKVGIGAALGAAIGAIAGGGKGAGVGAGVGGAAGAGDVLLTRGAAVELPVETRVSFRLAEAVTVTEKLR